ncbi:MAG: hypothetical protein ABW208_25135 [Pyrinomonadaceae bacterium]
MDKPEEAANISALTLKEESSGVYVAEHIYEGSDDFFSADASAAYEYNDGRCDDYPLAGPLD